MALVRHDDGGSSQDKRAAALGLVRPTGMIGNTINAATVANQAIANGAVTPGKAAAATASSGSSGSSKAAAAPAVDAAALYSSYLAGLEGQYNAQKQQYAQQLETGKQNARNQYNTLLAQINEQADRQKADVEASYAGQEQTLKDRLTQQQAQYAASAQTAKDTQQQAYEQALAKLDATTTDNQRGNYINMMQNQRRMGQLLTAMGLGGGASESAQLAALNEYLNAQNAVRKAQTEGQTDLSSDQAAQVAAIEQTLADQNAGALGSYQTAAADVYAAYMTALQQAAAAADSRRNDALTTYHNMVNALIQQEAELQNNAYANYRVALNNGQLAQINAQL